MSEAQRGEPTHEAIAARAYELYLERGEHGFDVDDWLRAEAELLSHPVTTAHDEAEVRGAGAAAVEDKRAADEAELRENPDAGQPMSPVPNEANLPE